MNKKRGASPQAFLLAMAIWIVGMLTASRLADGSGNGMRVAAVIIGVGSAIAWVRVVVFGIRGADEYARRVHALAMGIAFGGVGMTTMTVDWLQRARFVGPIEIGATGFLVVIAWWAAGMLIASRHYR